MKRRYKIRTHESGDRDGRTDAGTIVRHIGGSAAIEATTIDEADAAIRKQVAADKLPRGCFYQICPPPGSSELLRTLAIAVDGSVELCFLDNAGGLYSEFRRVRFPAPISLIESKCESHCTPVCI
jgi:hypothetical protein